MNHLSVWNIDGWDNPRLYNHVSYEQIHQIIWDQIKECFDSIFNNHGELINDLEE